MTYSTFKKYNGEKYKLAIVHTNKKDAERDAKKRRSNGYFIRIHKRDRKYLLYYRVTPARKKRERGTGYIKW